ncbi:MAG: response regulator [Methanomicrobiaceae archaeon]|nr:response regulator [Methanomicrobiaceae archaeon]
MRNDLEKDGCMPVKILIVEDDAIIAMDMEQVLSRKGYNVIGIIDRGEKVLPAIEKKQPDIVLMDINIKGNTDGVDVAKKLLDELGLKVIYVTAYSDINMKERAFMTEPVGYLIKPVRESELIGMIDYAMEKAKKPEQTNYISGNG